jgi:hypothetical protein
MAPRSLAALALLAAAAAAPWVTPPREYNASSR